MNDDLVKLKLAGVDEYILVHPNEVSTIEEFMDVGGKPASTLFKRHCAFCIEGTPKEIHKQIYPKVRL